MKICLAIKFDQEREFSQTIELSCRRGYFQIGSSMSADLCLRDPQYPERTLILFVGPKNELRIREMDRKESSKFSERVCRVGELLSFGVTSLKVLGYSGFTWGRR